MTEKLFRSITNDIFITANWLRNEQNQFLKSHNLTLQQYTVLRILEDQYPQPLSTSGIRDRMLDRMSDASRIVDRLVKKKLVIRKTNKQDKRLVDVVLSNAGKALLKEIEQHEGKMYAPAQQLSSQEAEQLQQLLNKIHHEEADSSAE